MKCTWDGCDQEGIIENKSKDGIVWATLCEKHDKMIIKAIEESDVKHLLSYWVKAQGGAKSAAKRMTGE